MVHGSVLVFLRYSLVLSDIRKYIFNNKNSNFWYQKFEFMIGKNPSDFVLSK